LEGKEEKEMRKMLTVLAVISILNFGIIAESKAASPGFQWGLITTETIDLLGTPVRNPGGEMLGTINAFVIDSQGNIALAILWEGVTENINAGRYVAVPLTALSISERELAEITVVLNMDRKTLDSAPGFDEAKDLNTTQWATGIYRHFGQMPYWTEEGDGKATTGKGTARRKRYRRTSHERSACQQNQYRRKYKKMERYDQGHRYPHHFA
jgi:hypothetical protein